MTVSGNYTTAYSSTLYANNYGFNVNHNTNNEGRFVSHTLPFGVVADSWPRSDLFSSIAQIFVLLAFFAVFEHLNRGLLWRHADMMNFEFAVLEKYALQFATIYLLTSTIRRTIVFLVFGIIVCFVIKFFQKIFFSIFSGLSGDLEGLLKKRKLPSK